MVTVDDAILLTTMFFLREWLNLVVEPTGALVAPAALHGGLPLTGKTCRGDPDRRKCRSFAGATMARSPVRRLLPLLFVAAIIGPPQASAQEDGALPRNQTPLMFLQLNDVYSTGPVDGLGGLARVATLKQGLSTLDRTVLMVLAADFLSPSIASSMFKVEQMFAALNAARLDLATLGNHKFDFGTEVLIQRMAEAKWQWVVSNVIDARTGKPVGGAAPCMLRTVGAPRVGRIGLCLTSSEISRDNLQHLNFDDPLEAAARYVRPLK